MLDIYDYNDILTFDVLSEDFKSKNDIIEKQTYGEYKNKDDIIGRR